MGRRFQIIRFGKKANRIDVILLKRPWTNGLVGMVQSKLFPMNVALVVDDTVDFQEEFNGVGALFYSKEQEESKERCGKINRS